MIKFYKNFLKGVFSIVFLLALFFSFSSVSEAQTTYPDLVSCTNVGCATGSSCQSTGVGTYACKTTPVTTPTTATAPATPATTEQKLATESGTPCSGIGKVYLFFVDRGACEIVLKVTEVIMGISAEFLALTAGLFDYATQKFILQISTLFNTDAGQESEYIYGAWSVIRDFANIIAFFGAIYTGFRYITGSDQTDFKKSVLKLFIYCIMVNFSFAISKFLIDISNVISLQVHGGILGFNLQDGYNISNRILTKMNISTLIGEVGSLKPAKFQVFNSFSVMWLAIVFIWVTFAAFLYASIMILVRSFILLICVILSPVMFLNFAFPQMNSLHEKWRENFFGQLMFAPLLMIGFWLAFILLDASMSNEASLSAGDVLNAMGTGGPSAIKSVVNMILAILAVVMAVKLSAAASGSAGKFVSGMVGGAMSAVGLAVATGGAGLAFRGVAGGASSMIKGSNWVQNATKPGSTSGRMSKGAASLLSFGADKMTSARVFGKDSVNDKVNQKSDKARKNIGAENLKSLGLSDTLTRAGSAKEVDEIYKEASQREERQKSNPNEKFQSYKFNREKTSEIKQDNKMQKTELKSLEQKRDSLTSTSKNKGDRFVNAKSLMSRPIYDKKQNIKNNQDKLDAINPPSLIVKGLRALKKSPVNPSPINKLVEKENQIKINLASSSELNKTPASVMSIVKPVSSSTPTLDGLGFTIDRG